MPNLIACEVVIPLASGKTRNEWDQEMLEDWEHAVAYLFGGCSPLALGIIGRWRDPALPSSRAIVADRHHRYEIAVPPERLALLRQFLLFTCAHFEQQCLYFKVGIEVELLDNPLGWP